MKFFFRSYGILVVSLAALFASGIVIGRLTAPTDVSATGPLNSVPLNADAWATAANRGLVSDLKLDIAQQQKIRCQLDPVAVAIFSDQERTLFQMHLRLLELHDTLAKEDSLSDPQLKRLAMSRTKLKNLIIKKFPRMVRENPSLVINEKPD